ncbi:MAG: tripartite tricarboxylate transporter TctB family protein [Rhodomicrobiaceae bacterium]
MSDSPEVAGRTQQTIVAAGILALGCWVAYVSFAVKDPQPYLFPQLIAATMVVLAVLSLIRAARGGNRTGAGVSGGQLLRIAPLLAMMLLYIFVLAPKLGYYVGAAISFFAIYTFYDPNPHVKPKSWLMRIAVTAGFVAVLYMVFALGLRVQTPRGLFL